MKFRKAKKEELETILKMYDEVRFGPLSTWDNEYPSINTLNEDYENDNIFTLVTEEEEIVGAISINKANELDNEANWEYKDALEFARVIIKKDYQGNHYSRSLVKNVEEVIKKRGYDSVHLCAAKKNYKALGLYRSLGYKEKGDANIFGHDFIMFEKDLSYPKKISEIIKGLSYKVDDIGRSKDYVYNFDDKFILKISNDIEGLRLEKEKNDWITKNLKGPKSIWFGEKDGKGYYLRECLNGDSLINERFTKDPKLLLNIIEKVIKELRKLDSKACLFKAESNGESFIHGDLCLPNIYVNDKNEFIGFIDVKDSGIGDIKQDYLWLLWSFEYNTKTDKYRDDLLKILGIEFEEKEYQEIVLKWL